MASLKLFRLHALGSDRMPLILLVISEGCLNAITIVRYNGRMIAGCGMDRYHGCLCMAGDRHEHDHLYLRPATGKFHLRHGNRHDHDEEYNRVGALEAELSARKTCMRQAVSTVRQAGSSLNT